MMIDRRQTPAERSLPAALVSLGLLWLGSLAAGLGGCAYSSEPPAGLASPAADETLEWIVRAELTAPPGARREPRPDEELPYFWRGAPVTLELELGPSAPTDGRLSVRWLDPDGETLRQEALPLDAVDVRPDGASLHLEGPETGPLDEAVYWVEVRWLPPGGRSPASAARRTLGFGIGEAEMAAIDPGDEAPAFPWPPPKPATWHVIEGDDLGGGTPPATLDEAADRLLDALARSGYAEHSFFSIQPDPGRPPEGFALVTRLEQIFPDGRPRPDEERWQVTLPARDVFSLQELVRALFTAPEGHYRVIVFAVTGRPVAASDEAPTREDAGEWLGQGLARLPRPLGELPWTPDHACTALIYQFRQVGAGSEPQVNPPDAPPARTQLERTGILSALHGPGSE